MTLTVRASPFRKWINFDLDQQQARRMSYYQHLFLNKSPRKLEKGISMMYGTLDAISDDAELAPVFMARDHGWQL